MSGSQAFISHANDGVVGGDPELAQALLLVRVSTMKMLRLQLALERRDKAVALQAVDDLIELDTWMADAGGRSADGRLLEAIAHEADDERTALLHERFGLAAGMVQRASELGRQAWIEPEPAQAATNLLVQAAGRAEAEEAYEFLGTNFEAPEEEVPTRRLRWLLVVALPLVILAAAAGVALVLGWRPEALLSQLLSLGGLS